VKWLVIYKFKVTLKFCLSFNKIEIKKCDVIIKDEDNNNNSNYNNDNPYSNSSSNNNYNIF